MGTNRETYTPGPWKACRAHEGFDGPYYDIDPDERAEYDAKPFVSIEAKGGERVTNAHDLFTFKPANARLIAAAPELLEALKALRAAVIEYQLLDVRKRFSLCVADAVAGKAITKAEGA